MSDGSTSFLVTAASGLVAASVAASAAARSSAPPFAVIHGVTPPDLDGYLARCGLVERRRPVLERPGSAPAWSYERVGDELWIWPRPSLLMPRLAMRLRVVSEGGGTALVGRGHVPRLNDVGPVVSCLAVVMLALAAVVMADLGPRATFLAGMVGAVLSMAAVAAMFVRGAGRLDAQVQRLLAPDAGARDAPG